MTAEKAGAEPGGRDPYLSLFKICADLLLIQRTLIAPSEKFGFEDQFGALNIPALGYVYGFADAAMQIAGLELEDERARMLLVHLYELFADGMGDRYLCYVISSLTREDMMEGVMLGGEDYNQWAKSEGKITPWGWGRCFSL